MTSQGLFSFIVFNSLVLFVLLSALALWLRPSWWLPLFSIFLGFIVGWLDVRSTEVSSSALMLLAFGIFIGFAKPRPPWLAAFFLGIGVPVFSFAGWALGVTHPNSIELVTSFLSLAFAFAGTYAGVLVRRLSPSDPRSAA